MRQLRRRLGVEGPTLKLEIGHIEPVRVRGAEESLRRVALVLLDNALKYTPTSNEEGKGHVIVSLERADGQAVLQVQDTGIRYLDSSLASLYTWIREQTSLLTRLVFL